MDEATASDLMNSLARISGSAAAAIGHHQNRDAVEDDLLRIRANVNHALRLIESRAAVA
jgi:hypothetical protein